jgi:hypothetical protein
MLISQEIFNINHKILAIHNLNIHPINTDHNSKDVSTLTKINTNNNSNGAALQCPLDHNSSSQNNISINSQA